MPAYRSSAEAEIRLAVVERLREIVPGCRIIHEINAESFGNRIDVLAVGVDRIAAVEIKSAKDKLDRLPGQIKAMRLVAHSVFAALHEKFLRDSPIGCLPPDEASGAAIWAYPRIERKGHVECGAAWLPEHRWQKPKRCLPTDALGILWREELHGICGSLGVKRVSSMAREQAIDEIKWRMTGEQITRTVCNYLRLRNCVEADPVIAMAA